MIKDCRGCDFYDCDFGCTCSSIDKWYACPLEPDPDVFDFEKGDFEE